MKAFLFLLFTAFIGSAASLCVAPSSSGTADGSDWNNALGASFTPVRGNIYYLASGNYGAQTFATALSGTSLITIKKATVASHGTDTGWSDVFGSTNALFAALVFGTSWWELDGVTGGGPGSWESGFGFRTKTAGFNFRLTDGAAGVISNITLKHIDAENAGRTTMLDNQTIFYAVDGPRNVTVQYCFWHDVSLQMFHTINCQNFLVEYSKLCRNGDTTLDAYHRTGWSEQDGDDVTIRYCIWEDISNTAILGLVNGVGTASRWSFYGNVVVWTGTNQGAAVPTLFDVRYSTPHFITNSQWKVFNNTIINNNGSQTSLWGASPSAISNECFNNIWFSNTCNAIYAEGYASGWNYYKGNWRTAVGEIDTSSATAPADQIGSLTPFLNWNAGDFRLAGATQAGTNTSAILSANSTDMFGNPRGGDGTWDRGAIEYGSTPSQFATINVSGTNRVGTLYLYRASPQ